MTATIAVAAYQPELVKEAFQLAQSLKLTLVNPDSKEFDYLLIVSKQRLELQNTRDKQDPIYIDFLGGKLQQRGQYSKPSDELIAKACGVKGSSELRVLDCTAGLGKDAFLLARLRCNVTMIERSAIIAALLADALKRASQSPYRYKINLTLIEADALDYLNNLKTAGFPDVIYLDPMFPERTKSALVKKEMRILKDLVGKDADIERLFRCALVHAKERVVVKRPKLANSITELKPQLVFEGKQIRYDVYLV